MKTILEYRKSAPLVDAAILVLLGILLWKFMVYVDLSDRFYEYSRAHEHWELDEIVLAVQTFGLMAFLYSMRWLIAARKEIARRRKAESDIAWLGHHDTLTRLPNRRFLSDLVARSNATLDGESSHCHAVYWLDLRGFKKINELHGHTGGDRFLVEIAERLKWIAHNELIVRQGGDEFVIVAENNHIGDPHAFARTIVAELEKPVRMGATHAQISVYLGYAVCPEHVGSLKSGVRCAGFALNVAKKGNGPRIRLFEEDMEAVLTEHAKLELGLARAVRNRQIVPHYQPIFDLATGRLHAFEALARWTRNGVGIPPSVFIPIAEEAGQIADLTDMLLRQACEDAAHWPSDLKLSFNISGVQLVDISIAKRIRKILLETGFPANRLEIEVTETALVGDAESAEIVLKELRDAGATIALDDFGTGYSSLAQLSRFTFDVLKIDRSFVDSFEHDRKQNKIVRAIVALSNGLDLATTAEGIETQTQLALLKDLGCRYGQGYLLGKPTPADQLVLFFEADAAARRELLLGAIKKKSERAA